jgi:8-oxo-dGTP diphosphatase
MTIRIAAALIDDDSGRLLLVRKTGTPWFMQAGGKIEKGEAALCALRRELDEEIGLRLDNCARYLGRFSAPAANEPRHVVVADIFHVRASHSPVASAEIAEAIWVSPAEAVAMRLAPLTRDHVLPLARTLKDDGAPQRDARGAPDTDARGAPDTDARGAPDTPI